MFTRPAAVEIGSFEDLLAAARGGDEKARNELLDAASRILLLRPPKMLTKPGAWHRDSDVLQEAFVKGLIEISTFQGSTSEQFLAWLRKIAARAGVDLGRQARAEKRGGGRGISAATPVVQESAAHTVPSAHAAAVRNEENARMRLAIAALPEDQKEAVKQRMEKLSWDEIGRRRGRRGGAVRQLHRRALSALGKVLTNLR